MYEKYDLADLRFDCWLEKEDGTRIQAERDRREEMDLFLLGVPSGKMRAVIQTYNGARHKTPLFEISIGKSIKTSIELGQ